MLRFIARAVNCLIPKKNDNWVFMSTPDYSDNPRALYEFASSKHTGLSCIWIVSSEEAYHALETIGIKSLRKKSIKAIWSFMSARVIITSHTNMISIRSKRQVLVNLWHGVPLKAIGFMGKDADKVRRFPLNDKNSITISTSTTVNTVLAGCFHVTGSQLFITAQPRNDDLFNPVSDSELSSLIDRDISKHSKIVFYMPTFRQGYLERTEGKNSRKREYLQI